MDPLITYLKGVKTSIKEIAVVNWYQAVPNHQYTRGKAFSERDSNTTLDNVGPRCFPSVETERAQTLPHGTH